MDNKEIALEVLKLTYRHDQKPEDLISRSKSLIEFIIGNCMATADVHIKKPAKNNSVI